MIERVWQQMGMPVSVRIVDTGASEKDIDAVETWFEAVNQRYSAYLSESEVSRYSRGEINRFQVSPEFGEILQLCDETRVETGGYFDIEHRGGIDPSGLVKGWAIREAANLLRGRGLENFCVEAGGDIEAAGLNADGEPWRIGIRNPFNRDQIVKVLAVSNRGVATSGTAIRGNHIYNPVGAGGLVSHLVSLTVVGPDIYEADRMATAAFAMGDDGLQFIAERDGLEGYAVTADGRAIYTSGFNSYVR